MTASAANLTTTADLTVTTGTLQGQIVSTTAVTVTLQSAAVQASQVLSFGNNRGMMTVFGTITVTGTLNVLTLTTIDGSTVLSGAGTLNLRDCRVRSGSGGITVSTIIGPLTKEITVFDLQPSFPQIIPTIQWAGLIVLIAAQPNTVLIGNAVMAAAQTRIDLGGPIDCTISAGNLQGVVNTTAPANYSLNANVQPGTNLIITGVGLTLYNGVLNAVGTGSIFVGSGVLVTAATLTGAGPIYLDQCTISYNTISTLR